MNKSELRKKYGYDEKDFILIYIAEFIPRKNHTFLLNTIPALREQIAGLKVILPGKGTLLKDMKKLAVDLEIDDIVKFLGYRKDIADLCRASDVYVSVSLQEGLPVSVIEAMACGLPIVASDIRGHRDNVVDGENGFLFAFGDSKRICDGVLDIYKSMELHERFSRNSVELAKKYDLKSIRLKMAKIYDEVESRGL
ncbi:MAG: glycosyltransferase family 4 protein [Treponema sp.]|nr:glycosyltransferase family 4 protein [Treponema sp.]